MRIYTHLIAHGWEKTIRYFKGEQLSETSVGEVITKAQASSSARATTFDAYSKAFR
ncbi:MAG: hypothetical protein GWQ05_24295 [Verrucomicrobiaceae bacterium]|nr:hypothetical protein [Verrucomicrobiaceae bacterium]